MSQISNPQQGQNHHPVQQGNPHRYAGPPQPVYQQQYDRNGIHPPQMMPQQNVYPTLNIPAGSQVAESLNNGHSFINIQAPPQGCYNPPPIMMHNGYSAYPVQHPSQMAFHQPPPAQQQQQPMKQPVPVRTKKILSFVNPENNSAVELPNMKEQKNEVPSSSPFESKSEVKQPLQNFGANPKETLPTQDNDINATFARNVANIVSAAKGGVSRSTSSDNNNAIIPSTPREESILQPSVKETTPVTKESTSIVEIQHDVSPAPEHAVTPSIVLEESEAETSGIDVEMPENLDVPEFIDRATLIGQYEAKVEEFFKVPENARDVINRVYSRSLIELLREIIRNFNTVPCPVSEEILRKTGIDRTTMPASANVSHKPKYQGRGDNFNPSWAGSTQANNIRRPYTSRSSDNKNNKNKTNQRPPQITNRPSIQRQPQQKLKRGPGAWEPDVAKQKAGVKPELDSVEARIEKVRKEVRGLLNKITPSTYKDLSIEMINKALWKDADTLPTVVELIFLKAVEEPTFVGIYSDLCLALHQAEQRMEKDKFERRFFGTIIRKSQTTFEQSSYQESVAKLEEKIKEETDEKKLADLNDLLDELKTKEKRRMLGTIRFISHLYRISLLNDKIIENCIVVLLRNADNSTNELMVEYAIHLIESVGPYVASKDADHAKKMDEYVVYLNKFKEKVSNRVRFMILGLADLSLKKWVKKGDGPKTKDEVKADVMKEEDQNRKDREVYEQSASDQRRKPLILAKQQPYGGRASADNKKDRLNVAVAASNAAGSSHVRKDTSLSKVDTQQRLGGTKKAWHANTNAPAAPPPQPQVIIRNKPMPSRSSTDARPFSSDVRKQSNPQNDRKPPPASNPNQKADSRPASATPPPVDASSSVSSADKFQIKAYKEEFTKAANLCLNEAPDEEVQKVLTDVFTLINDPVVFFGALLVFSCEHLKLSNEKERLAVCDWFVKFVQDAPRKKAFATAFKDYCNYIVSIELEVDVPQLKHTFPELVAYIMTTQSTDKKIDNSQFIEGFKEFHETGNLMFVRMLAKMANILKHRGGNEDDLGLVMSMTLEEFVALDNHYGSDEIKNFMASQEIDDENHENLKALLESA